MPENIMITSAKQELIFETEHMAFSQCDQSETFVLNLFDEKIGFRVCELIAFRRKIQQVDLTAMICGDVADYEIVSLPGCNRIFAFSLLEILELKSLFAGAFAMLELNSMIHQAVTRKLI